MASSEPPCKRRRLIIKFAKKPIAICYWPPENSTPPTIQRNSSKVDNAAETTTSVVVGTHNNIVADPKPPTIQENSSKFYVATTVKKSVVVADPKVCSKPPTTILKKACVDDVSLAARNEKIRPLLVKKENRVNQGLCASSKNGFAEIGLIKKENQKKPIEHCKKMQCWVILKRMIEGRDGWALKNPLDQKYLEKNKVAIGLKDIEAKLKSSYSTTDEFAKDMRFVFSHGLLYHPKNIVHKIAMKFSENFENKWKSLNEEWTLEEEKKVKHKIHKRKRPESVLSTKSDTSSMILKEQSKMYGSFKDHLKKNITCF